ncbi:ABC transporter permease [Thalassoroseus pseudoceratinae]|uniref:ABC transporter permease n=1 Tax=Thalassoroseus pseudoceratinae TaxID=2713176 RepID=UPI0014207A37|nr:ABC transporter permease [Thalassoroseus pseudoceratinae]
MSTETIAGVCEVDQTEQAEKEPWSDSVQADGIPQADVASLTEFVNVADRVNEFGLSFWKEAFQELRASRQVFWRLARREIVSRYRQSILGLGWAILTPLAMAGVFIYLNSANVVKVGDTGLPYPVFVFSGLIPWQMFAACLTRGSQSLVASTHLVQRLRCSREVLVLAAMASAVFDYLIGVGLTAIVLLGYGVMPASTALLLPVLVFMQFLFSFGIVLILSVMNAVLRDITSVIPLVINLWVFMTPVFFPTFTEGKRLILNWINPMCAFITAYRDLLFRGYLTMPGQLLLSCGITVVLLLAGWRFFHCLLPHVAEKA